MEIYILLEVNSNELQIDNPAVDIIDAFSNHAEAVQKMENIIYDNAELNYFPVEKTEDYCSLYYSGDENSPMYSELMIVKREVK